MTSFPRGAAAAALLSTALLSTNGLLDAVPAQAAGNHAGGHGAAIGAPAEPGAAGRTVEIVMHDNYFEPERVDIDGGQTVRFVVRNEGSLVHEFNIGTAAMHAAHQEEMAMMVEHGVLEPDRIDRERMKMDMGGGHTMAHDDPNSVLLEPGQSAEIVWQFPDNGVLEFACNVPGHYQAGMVGDLTVRK